MFWVTPADCDDAARVAGKLLLLLLLLLDDCEAVTAAGVAAWTTALLVPIWTPLPTRASPGPWRA